MSLRSYSRFVACTLLITSFIGLSACSNKADNTKKETSVETSTKNDVSIADNAQAALDKANAAVEKVEARAESIDEQLSNFEIKPVDMTELYENQDKYLEWNAKRAGVITTDSGLQYKVLTQGDGPKPTRSSVVSVHYKGTFPDGRKFDASYDRGKPTQFPVTRVIAGWTEALLLMNEGTKLEVVVPSNLAYGERGTPGGPIPPNQLLKFDIELLEADFKK